MVFCSEDLRGELWLSEDEVLGGNLSFLLGQPESDQDRERCVILTLFWSLHSAHLRKTTRRRLPTFNAKHSIESCWVVQVHGAGVGGGGGPQRLT